MRLADRHGQPLSQVLSDYPAWELPYWAVWISREPTDGQRVEFAVARFMTQWLHANSKKGARVPQAHELVMPDYWNEHAQKEQRAAAKQDVSLLVAEFARAGHAVKKRDDYL